MDEIQYRHRLVREDGVVLPYPEKVFHVGSFPAGEVFVPYGLLEELDGRKYGDSEYSSFLVSSEIKRALEHAGWANMEIRGGCYGSEKFHEEIFPEITNFLYGDDSNYKRTDSWEDSK